MGYLCGRWARTLVLLLLVHLPSGQAFAEGIEWQGFLTTSMAFTDADVPTQTGVSKKVRLTEETFLGLNLSKAINDEWRFASQILAHAGQADGAARIDWAFVTYEPDNAMEVTLGKQKAPVWMMSAYLDVGRAYPWIAPPEEVYSVFNLKSFTGVGFSYTLDMGESSLAFKPYYGDMFAETNHNAPSDSTKLGATNMLGAGIEWTWNKLLLRGAYNKALWDLDLAPTLNFGERRIEILTAGFKAEFLGMSLWSEYVSTRDLDEDHYLKRSDEALQNAIAAATAGNTAAATQWGNQALFYKFKIGGSKAYYATIGRQMAAFFLHLTYANLKKPALDKATRDQKSVALGLNYDVTVDSVIKVEAKKVFVPDESAGLFEGDPGLVSEAMIYHIGYSLIF